MYLRDLHVRGIKLLRDFRLSFLRPDGTPRQWTVLVGDNGLCKTTVLQCIALAASGETQANRLAEKHIPSLPEKRDPPQPAVIDLGLGFRPDYHAARVYPDRDDRPAPPTVRSTLTLAPRDTAFVGSSRYVDEPLTTEDGTVIVSDRGEGISVETNPLDRAQRTNEPHWFIAAYGVGRYLPEPSSTGREEGVRSLDRARSLFDPRYQIFGTDFVDRFAPDEAREYVDLLRKVLVRGGVLPNVKDIELRGAGGISKSERLVESHRFEMELAPSHTVKLPATWLSQGYQGTISWISDIVGQIVLEARQPIQAAEMEGVVLIDEIDLHLHPTWQRSIIRALTRVFPKLQFVATSHSPMILPALERGDIWRLRRQDDGSVQAEAAAESPQGMTGTEIYEAFFDIPPRDRKVEKDLDEYGRLSLDPGRTDDEDAGLSEIRGRLVKAGVTPGWEPVPRKGRSA